MFEIQTKLNNIVNRMNLQCPTSTGKKPSYLGKQAFQRVRNHGAMTPTSIAQNAGEAHAKPSYMRTLSVRNATSKESSSQLMWSITSFHAGSDKTLSWSGLTCNPSATPATIPSRARRGGAVKILKSRVLQTVEVSRVCTCAKLGAKI